MSGKEEKEEETMPIASTWLIPVEPEVEIKECESALEVCLSEEEVAEEHSSDSEEENNFQAVQELESVLVDKMCQVCGNLFQTFELVNAEPNKPLLSTCETCSYYITPPVVAIYESSSLSEYSCDKCPKTFIRKDKLLRHKATHSNKKLFACDLCEKSYKRHDGLTEHMRLVHTGCKPVVRDKCVSCGSVDNIIRLNVGENAAEFIKLCEACNLSRQEQISKLTQNGLKVFSCDLCSRFFSRREHVTRHRLSHLDVKPFECSVCKKTFSRHDRLLRHMRIHPGAKPFSCRFCSKAFVDRATLKSHLSTHPKLNGRGYPIKCETCQKMFRDKDKLTKHMISHEKTKSCVCEVCGKMFKRPESLVYHQKIHSQSTPFKCDKCGLEFKVKEIYNRHLLVHSDVKIHKCTLCNKTFKRKDKLQAHNLVHIDIKPYTCNICDSAFKRKDKYTRHLKQVHKLSSGEIIYSCVDCDLTFASEDDLAEHKMVHYH